MTTIHVGGSSLDTIESGDFFASRRLLDIPTMAKLMGTTERMPRRLIAERRLPTVKIGRHVRVWSDDLAAYLEANTRPSRGAA